MLGWLVDGIEGLTLSLEVLDLLVELLFVRESRSVNHCGVLHNHISFERRTLFRDMSSENVMQYCEK